MAIRFLSSGDIDGALTINSTVTLNKTNNVISIPSLVDNGTFLEITQTGNETWLFKCESLSGSLDGVSIGVSGAGKVAFDENGQIHSTQLLDVATAGGRLIGESSRGYLSSIHLEQSATGADGGNIRFETATSGTTSGVERLRITDTGAFSVGSTGTNYGSSGQVLTSGGNSNPTWTTPTTGTVTGTGTVNKVARWETGGTAIGNGPMTFSGTESSFEGLVNISRGAVDTTGFAANQLLRLQNTSTVDGSRMTLGFQGNSSIGSMLAMMEGVNYDQSLGSTDIRFSCYSGSAWNDDMVTFQHTGRVGIGTSSPSRKLVVAQSNVTEPSGIDANTGILIKNNTWSGIQIISTEATGGFLTFGDNAAGFAGRIQYLHASNAMVFETAASERMRIFSNGNVNIGVAEAGASAVTGPFVVTHTSSRFLTSSYEESAVSLSAKNGNNNLETLRLAGDSIKFFNGTNAVGSLKMIILNTGSVGIGTTSPAGKLQVVNNSQSTAALTVCNEANGGDGFVFQKWQYVESTSNFRLDLKQRVTSGVVQYAFDMVNNGTGYTSVLVLDRGNVGIGTTSPQYKLDVDGQIRAEGIVNIGGIGVAASGALANVDINDTDTNGTSTTYQPNITFKAAGVLKAQIGKLSNSTNYFTAAKNFDGPVNIIASEIHSGHTHIKEYIFGYEPSNSGNTWGLNIVDDTNTANSIYIGAEGLNNTSSIFFHGYTNALCVTRISLNQSLGQWLFDAPDCGTSSTSVKWRKYNIAGYMQNMINFESSGTINNITGSYGTISSDERVKENVVEATSKLDDILSLKVKNFNFIGDDFKQIGLIAQEVEEVFPSWVTTDDTRIYKTHDEHGVPLEEQGELVSGYEDGKGLKVGMEFAVLVKTIQELNAKIVALESRINEM